jgi:hypothetical protein
MLRFFNMTHRVQTGPEGSSLVSWESSMGDQFSPLDLTPDEFRRLGHEVVDRIASHLGELRDTPVATPQAIRGLLGQRRRRPPSVMISTWSPK